MAKRTRASRSAHRPGGQGPSRTKKASGTEPGSATPAEPEASTGEVIAATDSDVEVDEVAVAAVAASTSQATEAPPEAKSGRRVRRRTARTSKKRSQDDLAARAAAETVWVRADLRRIGVVSVVLFVALGVAYVIFGVVDVLNLY